MVDGTVRCIDSEIPFEIPDSWEWVRIRTISQSYIGLTYSPADVSASGTIVLRSSNIQNGNIDLSDLVRVGKEIPSKLNVAKNDIIICARNGSAKLVGKSAIVRELEEPMTFGAFMAICKTPLYEYVYAFLQSELFFVQLRGVSSTTTINQLTQNSFNNFIIPIPPIEEQERIIRKINQLLPLVELYGHKQDTLLMLNSNIEVNLRKSILQEAIQGRLVPQIESEGTAEELLAEIRAEKERLVKEGKLKKSALANESRIFRGEDNRYYLKNGSETECIDECPLDIPSSWKWVTLGELIVDSTGLSYKKESLADKSEPFIRVLRGGNIEDGIMRFHNDDVFISAKYVSHNLLLTKGTYISPAVSSLEKIGKTAIVDRNYTDTVVGGFVLMLTPTFCDIWANKRNVRC